MSNDETQHRRAHLDKQIGARLEGRRKQIVMSQEALANLADIPLEHLQAIEAGQVRPTASILSELSLHLGVSITNLFLDLDLARKEGAVVSLKDSCKPTKRS